MTAPCPLAVEFGLMSTTSAKDTAIAYSGVTKERGIVFEIQVERTPPNPCRKKRGMMWGSEW